MQPNVALVSNQLPAYEQLLQTPPANDVDAPRPALRSVARFALAAALDGTSEDTLYADLSYDVAMGGVFVATFDPPPVGARVEVMLTLPDARALAVSGIVRFIRDAELASDGLPAGCGIEWKGLSVEAARALVAHAAEHEPLLYLPEAA